MLGFCKTLAFCGLVAHPDWQATLSSSEFRVVGGSFMLFLKRKPYFTSRACRWVLLMIAFTAAAGQWRITRASRQQAINKQNTR